MRIEGRGGVRGSPRGLAWVVLAAAGLGVAGWLVSWVVATWLA